MYLLLWWWRWGLWRWWVVATVIVLWNPKLQILCVPLPLYLTAGTTLLSDRVRESGAMFCFLFSFFFYTSAILLEPLQWFTAQQLHDLLLINKTAKFNCDISSKGIGIEVGAMSIKFVYDDVHSEKSWLILTSTLTVKIAIVKCIRKAVLWQKCRLLKQEVTQLEKTRLSSPRRKSHISLTQKSFLTQYTPVT